MTKERGSLSFSEGVDLAPILKVKVSGKPTHRELTATGVRDCRTNT